MAQLSINQRQAGDVAILDLNGEVRIGDSATALRGAIRELVAAGNKKILLILRSSLHRFQRHRRVDRELYDRGRTGGQLKLLSLTDKVQDLLVITKLLTVFDVYEAEAEALSSFK
jgi:anti-sigma B factor antagonist